MVKFINVEKRKKRNLKPRLPLTMPAVLWTAAIVLGVGILILGSRNG